jgi:hypothetical protein
VTEDEAIQELDRWGFFGTRNLSLTGYAFNLAARNPIIKGHPILDYVETCVQRKIINKNFIAFGFTRSRYEQWYNLKNIVITDVSLDSKDLLLDGFSDSNWVISSYLISDLQYVETFSIHLFNNDFIKYH